MDPRQSKKLDVAVGRKLMNAIGKLQGNKGISLRDLKTYLRDTKKMEVGALDGSIKLALKKAMDRGILTRDDGNYKLKEAKRRRSKKATKSSGKGRRRKGRSGSPKRRSKRSGSKRKKSSGKRSKRRRRRKTPAPEGM